MSEYNYSSGHIQRLLDEIEFCKLSVPSGFGVLEKEELRYIYNGIGPESWSRAAREKTTQLLSFFEAEALIHDWEFIYQPRYYEYFTLANLRFGLNALKSAYCHFGLSLNFFRHAMRGFLLASLCQLFGYRAWKKIY